MKLPDPNNKYARCLLIAAVGLGLFFGCLVLAGFFGFLGPLGYPFYLLCLFALTVIPGATVLIAVVNLVKRLWLVAIITSLAITLFFTLVSSPGSTDHRIIQASVSPERYDAVIVTKKESALLTLYCFPPRNLFDVYHLQVEPYLEMKKLATLYIPIITLV
jgi:hypothetical protein